MANENNHGGKREGSGRPPIQRIELTLDLSKRANQPFPQMAVKELSERRGANMQAIRTLTDVVRTIKDFSPGAGSQISGLIDFLTWEIEEAKAETNMRSVDSHRYQRASFTRQATEIPREIAGARSRIRDGEGEVKKKRERLLEADINASEVARLVPDFDPAEDLQLIEKLEAERAQWEKWQQYLLPEYLPANADECVLTIGVLTCPPTLLE